MAAFDQPLTEQAAGDDPFALFHEWYEAASALVRLPDACTLATASASARPSARMVLCKGASERGFVFYSHYTSRKGEELAQNPYAALVFYWDPLGRQVRVEGAVELLDAAQSDAYFASRPRGSQLGAVVSRQSQPIAERSVLDEAVQALSAEPTGAVIERPSTWGGYLLRADSIEFWQNRDDRLHDRLLYRRSTTGWSRQRLQP